MFIANLRNYVFGDDKKRLRDNRVSLIIALAFSGYMLMIGQSENLIALESLAVLAVAMLCLTVYSCATAPQTAAGRLGSNAGKDGLLYRPVSRRLALLSGISIVLLAALPGVEAAALDRRLRRLTRNVPLDPGSIREVRQTVEEAVRYKVRLPTSSLKAVVAALNETSKADPNLAGAALNAGGAVASAATVNIEPPEEMRDKALGSIPKGSAWTFMPIAANTGPDNYATIGLARQPHVAKMDLIDKPNPPGSDYGPAFLVVKGLTAALDGYLLKNVVFQDMILIYHGGPLILEDVYFFHCEFRFDPSEETWRLLSAVTAGGWVRFSTVDSRSTSQ